MKIIKIITIAFTGIIAISIALYLITGFLVIPLALPKVVTSQGTKFLKHPVSLGGASFNPLTLRLVLRDFKILDTDRKEMVGFDSFWIDIDTAKLIRKKYRIESLGCDGLRVDVVLLPGNRINLLSLKPESTPTAEKPSGETPGHPPELVIDEILFKNGTLVFSDRNIGIGFTMKAHDMNLRVTGISTKPESQVKLNFTAKIDETGTLETDAMVKPFAQTPNMEASFSLNGYAMQALTPYVGKYTGRAVKKDGKLDVRVAYRIENNLLNAGHKVLIQNFDLGEKVESKDALPLPFGLALALLKDTHGRIDVSLPVKGDTSDPQFEYFPILGKVAVNFFMKLVTAPFNALALLVPGGGGSDTQELGVISFAPGTSVLSDTHIQKLGLLIDAMKERPKLSFVINGTYDPEIDWKAIRTGVFEEELQAAILKEPNLSELQHCEKLYKSRFGSEDYQALKIQFTTAAVTNEVSFLAAMKDVIIEKGSINKRALEQLAQARAQAVYETIIASGFTPARTKPGAVRAAVATMGLVPTEFVLTVFDAPPEEQTAK